MLPLGGDRAHGSHKGYGLGAMVDLFVGYCPAPITAPGCLPSRRPVSCPLKKALAKERGIFWVRCAWTLPARRVNSNKTWIPGSGDSGRPKVSTVSRSRFREIRSGKWSRSANRRVFRCWGRSKRPAAAGRPVWRSFPRRKLTHFPHDPQQVPLNTPLSSCRSSPRSYRSTCGRSSGRPI